MNLRSAFRWSWTTCLIATILVCSSSRTSLAESKEKKPAKRIVFTVSFGGKTVRMILQAFETGLIMWDGSTQPPPAESPEVPASVTSNATQDPPVAQPSPATAASQPSQAASTEQASSEQSSSSSTNVVSNDSSNPPNTSDVSADRASTVDSHSNTEQLEQEVAETLGKSESNKEAVPDWVEHHLKASEQVTFQRDGDYYLVAVDGLPSSTLEECRQSMDQRLLAVARAFVDHEFFGQSGRAEQVDQLTIKWIKSHWLVKGLEYDKLVHAQGDEFHQLWMQLKIHQKDRRIIEEWSSEVERQERVKSLAGGTVISIGGLGLLHVLVGLFARRKKSKTPAMS